MKYKEIKMRIAIFREAHPEIDWDYDPFYKPPVEELKLSWQDKLKLKRNPKGN